jgi:hypothetical protein
MPYDQMTGSVWAWIIIAVLFQIFGVVMILARRTQLQNFLELSGPVADDVAHFILVQMESAAPHISHLRTVGMAVQLGPNLRAVLTRASEGRARRIFECVDGRTP